MFLIGFLAFSFSFLYMMYCYQYKVASSKVLQLTSPQPPRRNRSSLAQLTAQSCIMLLILQWETFLVVSERSTIFFCLCRSTVQYCMKKRSKDSNFFPLFLTSQAINLSDTLRYIQFKFSYRIFKFRSLQRRPNFERNLLICSNKL